MAPSGKLTPVSFYVIRVSFMGTGLYLGALNPACMKDLAAVMGKYKVQHIEMVLVPQPAGPIRIQVGDPGDEGPGQEGGDPDIGPDGKPKK